MGSWGISAFESDDGLDALSAIRGNLSPDGSNRLEDLMQALKNDKDECPPPIEKATSHSSYMALAEIVVSYLDGDLKGLDYEDDEVRFSDVRSFTASRPALQELREYLAGTLDTSRKRAEQKNETGQYLRKWDGWFKEESWTGWQKHIEGLISRLDGLLSMQSDEFQLCQPGQEQREQHILSAKEKAFFAELTIQLKRGGFDSDGPDQDGLLVIEQDGQELCKATGSGGVRVKPEVRDDPQTSQALDRAVDIVCTTDEYTELLRTAPPLKTSGLKDRYKLLADFNGTVLAGTQTTYGAQFVTWEWNYEHTGVGTGHYFEGETGYKAAKRDFAVRSELVPLKAQFTPEQLTDLYECVKAMKQSCGDATYDFEKRMEKLMEQIEELVPGVQKHGILELNTPMTVREFLMKHPKDTVSMLTPAGYCCMTPTDAKRALEGEKVVADAGVPDCTMELDAGTILDDIPGLAVWKSGHIGVYIGNGEVIEAMGTKYGVVKTKLSERNWSAWLGCRISATTDNRSPANKSQALK